jgi:hypothetical protein
LGWADGFANEDGGRLGFCDGFGTDEEACCGQTVHGGVDGGSERVWGGPKERNVVKILDGVILVRF